MAPSLLTLLKNIPRIIAGNIDAAAKPKANATTAATKSEVVYQICLEEITEKNT